MLSSWALRWALPTGYSCLPQQTIDGLGSEDCPLLAVEIHQSWKPIPSLPSVQHIYSATPPVTYRYLELALLKLRSLPPPLDPSLTSSMSSSPAILSHSTESCPWGHFILSILLSNPSTSLHAICHYPCLGWAFSPQITVLPPALVYCPFYWFPITAAMSLLKHRLDSVTPLFPFMMKPKLIYMP